MDVVIGPQGRLRMLYDETLNLGPLGEVAIRRASHVEPIRGDHWVADLSPVGGPVLGPFALRSQAVAAELAWLGEHWLQ